MARFHGQVGYGLPHKTPGTGVVEDTIVERPYSGDLIRQQRNLDQGDKVINDISFAHSISIVADPYAIEHYARIKYVMVEGVRWIVTSVVVQRPRLTLSLGGVYHGPTP